MIKRFILLFLLFASILSQKSLALDLNRNNHKIVVMTKVQATFL